jgi:hypothetical protein
MSDSVEGGIQDSIRGAAQSVAGGAQQVAGTVQRGGGEVTEVIRAQPIAAVLILFAVGYALGRFLG